MLPYLLLFFCGGGGGDIYNNNMMIDYYCCCCCWRSRRTTKKKENIVNYNITNYRSAKHEVSLVWNDKDLKIRWPIKNPIVSKRDKMALTFNEYKKILFDLIFF